MRELRRLFDGGPDGGSEEVARGVVDVKDDFEIEIVQGLDLFGGMVEGIGIEFQRAMAGVPTIGAIAGAQVDEAVARQLVFAKRARDLQRVLGAKQRAVR